MYFIIPSMYLRVNLKMKKPTVCCCFSWIVFIELNFTFAFLLKRTTWDDRFASKLGGGNFKKWGDPSNGGDHFLKWGLIPLYRLCLLPQIPAFSQKDVFRQIHLIFRKNHSSQFTMFIFLEICFREVNIRVVLFLQKQILPYCGVI